MNILCCDELRLLYALILNSAVFVLGYLTARKITRDRIQQIVDAFLIFYLVQYLAVSLPGLLGILNFPVMAGAALVLSAAIYIAIPRPVQMEPDQLLPLSDRLVLAGAYCFVLGYVGMSIYNMRYTPVLSQDALTYHLPAAAQWLRTGSLGLYEVWFWNPANTFSPLGGSTFMAWLIAPMRNDVLVRFVQVPVLLLIFFAMIQLCRTLGCSLKLAALLAAAAVLLRPFVSHTIIIKDDLFVAAFFICAVVAMSPERLRERFSTLRLGIALGLFLSIKYPALLSLPLLLLVVDLPWKNGWRIRHWLIVAGVAALLASPWYLRNLWLSGNPIFPTPVKVAGVTIFDGTVPLKHSDLLRTANGLKESLISHYHGFDKSTPWLINNDEKSPWPVMTAMVILGWLISVVISGKRIWTWPFYRLCIFGSLIGISLFIFTAPYAEIRFIYPSLLLLFACWAIPLARFAGAWYYLIPVALMMGGVALVGNVLDITKYLMLVGACAGVVGMGWILLPRLFQGIAAGIVLLAIACTVYVFWPFYRNTCIASETAFYTEAYPRQVNLWSMVDHELKGSATIAYTNTFLVRPLLGEDYRHRAIYIPVRHNVRHIQDLPSLPKPIPGEQIADAIATITNEHPDRAQWLKRLADSQAQWLVIFRTDKDQVPEMEFARSDPLHFRLEYDTPGGLVYQITRN